MNRKSKSRMRTKRRSKPKKRRIHNKKYKRTKNNKKRFRGGASTEVDLSKFLQKSYSLAAEETYNWYMIPIENTETKESLGTIDFFQIGDDIDLNILKKFIEHLSPLFDLQFGELGQCMINSEMIVEELGKHAVFENPLYLVIPHVGEERYEIMENSKHLKEITREAWGFTLGANAHMLTYLEININSERYFVLFDIDFCNKGHKEIYMNKTKEGLFKLLKVRYLNINFWLSNLPIGVLGGIGMSETPPTKENIIAKYKRYLQMDIPLKEIADEDIILEYY